jgi:amino acid transporter
MSDISKTAALHDDDRAIIEAGYTPQLRRSLGFFSSFAISFSFMSVLMGIYANYGYVLGKAGPFGFWTWLLVGAGQFLVALVFAEMAGRIPLTGAIYNWNTRLANSTVGWFTAWMMMFAYSIGCVGVIVAIMAPLQTLLGITLDSVGVRIVGTGIILLQLFINVYGVKLAAHTNRLAVAAEIIALVVFGTIILSVILIHGEVNTALLTHVPEGPTPYWPSFLMASLLAAWTIFGFETPVDLSEETVNVRRVTPKSILSSVIITVVLGFAFLTIITLAIPDLATVTAASDPISMIVSGHLGAIPTKLFLAFVVIAIFASSMLGITTSSRLLFAVGRDRGIIGSSHLVKISAHGVPKIAMILVSTIEIVTLLWATDMAALYAAPVILLGFAYLATILSFIFGNKKLPPTDHFSLGRWHWPVVILAVTWLVVMIGILTIPDEFHPAAKIAAVVFAIGVGLYFASGRSAKKPA